MRYGILMLILSGFLSVLSLPAATAEDYSEIEPNNKPDQAREIKLPCFVRGGFSEVDSYDYYVFEVPAEGRDSLYVEMDLTEGVDAILTLLDAENAVLTESDFFEMGETEYLTSLLLSPGTYYLRVFRKRHDSEGEQGYELRVGSTPPVTSEDVRTALNRALDFVVSQQAEDGGFNSRIGNAAITGLAVQALLGAGCLKRDDWNTVYRAVDYIKTCFHSPEEFTKPGRNSDMKKGGIFTNKGLYEHAISLTALVEAYAMGIEEDLPEIIKQGIDFLERAQVSERRPETLFGPMTNDSIYYGGWRYAADSRDADLSVTGWQIIALVAAQRAGFDVHAKTLEWAEDFVNKCYIEGREQFAYRPGGLWSVGRCAMGALSLQLSGKGDVPAVKKAIRVILTSPPTWEGEPFRGPYPIYYWYYGSRAAYLDGGKTWEAWKQAVCGMLVRHQNKDGSWELKASEKSHLDAVYGASLGALILEICCGSPPMYMHRGEAPPRPTPRPRNEISVAIEYPIAGEKVKGNIEIVAAPVTPERVKVEKVTFSLNGEELGVKNEEPWTWEADLGPGVQSHTFVVSAENNLGKTAEATTVTGAGQNIVNIKIIKPRSGSVSPQEDIIVEATAHEDSPLAEVVVLVDDEEIYNGGDSPPPLNYRFSPGEHVIIARAKNCLGKEAETRTKISGSPPLPVDLTVMATDENNRPVLDLKKSDFTLLEDGDPQEILRFGLELTPVSMAVVVDTSGSMKRAMSQVQQAAIKFVSQTTDEDRVMVIAFSDKASVKQRFTSNQKSLIRAIENTVARGGTALYDSLWLANLKLKPEKGRKAIILLTDGKDENWNGTAPGSTHNLPATLKMAEESEVTIYALGLGKGVAKEVLKDLAEKSGGRAYFPPTPKDLEEVYKNVARDIRSQYTIGYDSTNPLRDGSWREVRISVPGRNIRINARKGYYAK